MNGLSFGYSMAYLIASVEIFLRPEPFPSSEGFGGTHSILPGWTLQGITRNYRVGV